MAPRTRVIQIDREPVIHPPAKAAPWRQVRPVTDGTETRWRDTFQRLHVLTVTERREGNEEDGTLCVIRQTREVVKSAPLPYSVLKKKACKVVEDDECRAPWEDCDGWDHHLETTGEFRGDDLDRFRDAQGVFRHGSEGLVRIVFDYDLSANYDYHHTRGASKQVARQLVAAEKRRSIEQLRKWYVHGWQWFGAVCKWGEYDEALWGIDDEKYAWQVLEEEMMPGLVAHVESLGYLITGKPQPRKRKRWTKKSWREHLRRNLNSQHF